MKIPCAVVCASNENSTIPEAEFRFSFATAEQFLIRNLSDIQIASYCCLKFIQKQKTKNNTKQKRVKQSIKKQVSFS